MASLPSIAAAAERLRASADREIAPVADTRRHRLTAALRVALTVSGLVVYCIDPSEHPGRRHYAYAVLAAFTVYAVVVWRRAARGGHRGPSATPWVDVAWTTALIAVSDGTSSIFFPLYVFAILGAAFDDDFGRQRTLVLAAVLSFGVVGGATAPSGARFELDRSLFRPLYLLIAGYLIVHLGEHERRQRRRLELLRVVTSLSNPRFGIERTMGRILGQLREFHAATSCRLFVREPSGESWMRVATGARPPVTRTVAVPPPLVRMLAAVPATCAVLYRGKKRCWESTDRRDVELYDVAGGTRAEATRGESGDLPSTLDAASFLIVPFRYAPAALGRVVVTSSRPRAFDASDVDFLLQALQQVVPVLENIRLVDRLASDAADQERRRIATDLHDSVIQPYIGLRMGIAAARQSAAAGEAGDAVRLLDRLAVMAEDEIASLRSRVHTLRQDASTTRPDVLSATVARFCRRFSEATGIEVMLNLSGATELNDRLAAEVFQMIAEALSNVRRHTDARSAAVHMTAVDGRLRLVVEDDGSGDDARSFTPKSLQQRAAALGGAVQVRRTAAGETSVRIEVPL